MELHRILRDNEQRSAAAPDPGVGATPARGLAVVTCMDVRIDPVRAFGLDLGSAHVLRNAGGRVTGDVLRSLALSCWTFGVREVGVIHHTSCGVASGRVQLERGLRDAGARELPPDLWAIDDADQALDDDVDRVRDCAWLPDDLVVWGARFDVVTGDLEPRTGDPQGPRSPR